MDDSVIICDEVIDADTKLSPKDDDHEKKPISKNFNKNKATCKTQNFYILFAFLLITITLIAISIYCYGINVEQSSYYRFTKQIIN